MKLLFYKGTKSNPSSTIWDNIICFVTNSKYSHVELSFGLSFEWTNNYYRCWSSSTRDNGVREKWIDTSDGHWTIIDVDRCDIGEGFFENQEGFGYDYTGLIGTVIPLSIFSSKYKWFCSEIIAEYLGINNSWNVEKHVIFFF